MPFRNPTWITQLRYFCANAGPMNAWCLKATRVSVWMHGWCSCCGCPTRISWTPRGLSCTLSRWRTASSGYSPMAPSCMPSESQPLWPVTWTWRNTRWTSRPASCSWKVGATPCMIWNTTGCEATTPSAAWIPYACPSTQWNGEYPRLVLCFELRRNILYFILETYIPSALLVVLSWVSFWLSMASVPARTCIGVTTVLSMTTLMMGSRDSLPTANGVIKAIDVFLGICFSFIFGALLEYAVGHYCAEQMAASKKLKKNMTEELEEITISSVINSSLPSIKRKKSLTLKDPQDGGDGAESDLKKNDNTFKYVLQTKKRISKIINFFSVENPANVDRYSRMVFPLVFLVVNVFYWAYYLYL
ncbi:gamma-aminobutyric acid receptor subunit pi isoform X2 [Ambystoma mexicanum]|uniref:gamma-aminobutyric acid receptor subunit pi isoform X2 n=1 Tax=Ambystoma mexicanum TaxID=8296 RepID=UPI0037E9B12A